MYNTIKERLKHKKKEIEMESKKFNLCIIPTQFGKTFTAIKRMKYEIAQDEEMGRSIHVVFTMNTLLNNSQFSERLNDIEEEYDINSICIFASKYEGKYNFVKNLKELKGECLDEYSCPRVLVMCSNGKRFEDGTEFIEVLNRNIGCITRVFIYYDELHKYINDDTRRQIEKIHDMDITHGIIALSATPDKIWKSNGFWSRLNLVYLNDFNDENYIGYRDMLFNCVDDIEYDDNTCKNQYPELEKQDRKLMNFTDEILNRNENILGVGTRTFIPGLQRVKSHNFIRKMIFTRNKECVVIMLNGFEKTIKYNDENGRMMTINLNGHDDEICNVIGGYIMEYKLEDRPIVMTGYICVSMGQTLSCESLGSFTSAIFGHLSLKNDEIYQLFGRITGRMRNWKSYEKTKVYCYTDIMNRCSAMEDCARNMARLALDNDNEKRIVCRNDYIKPIQDKKVLKNMNVKVKMKKEVDILDRLYMIFDTQDHAIEWSRDTFKNGFKSRSISKAPVALQMDGKNPTIEYVLKRWWGINKINTKRMVPLDDGRWIVYWNKSLIEEK